VSLRILLAAAAIALVPASASAAPKTSSATASAPAKRPDPMQTFLMMNKLMDKFLPADPEPEPARLAAARDVTMTMFPKGIYAEAMNGFIDSMAQRVLDMSEADLAELMPPPNTKLKKGEKPKVPSTEPLRLALARKDPIFEPKLAAGKAFAKAMFVKFGDVAEPKFREGMARSLARKFDAQQMSEIRAFLATPTGAAYGRQIVGLWFEPDVMRGTFQALPEMMKLMPELMKDAAVLDAQTKAADKK
jgi:hypothetical protein